MAGLGAVDGGYFPGEWGLATLAFTLVGGQRRPDRRPAAARQARARIRRRPRARWRSGRSCPTAWSPGATAQVLEAERGLLYVAAAAAAILLLSFREAFAATARRRPRRRCRGRALRARDRLFPGHVGGAYDPSSGYQLAEPIGYWNALGILDRARAPARRRLRRPRRPARDPRAARSVSLVVLLPTLYFTFWRGALVALVVGAIVQIAVDPRRATAARDGARCCGAPALLAVYLASRYHALTTAGDSLTTAQRRGPRAARKILVVLVHRRRCGRGRDALRRAAAAVLCPRRPTARGSRRGMAVLVVLGGNRRGGRTRHGRRARLRLVQPVAGTGRRRPAAAPPQRVAGNGRSDYWRVARTMVADEPLLGTGAGSFEAHWFRERAVAFHARDAHNLYLETLAELGPVGLALLLATLALPLLALPAVRRFAVRARCRRCLRRVSRARRRRLGLGGSRGHRAGDLLRRRPPRAQSTRRAALVTGRRRAAALALLAPLAAVALVAHVGNRAAAASIAAIESEDPARGLAEAKRAAAWAPWSEEPWQLRGEAELGLGDEAAARRSLAERSRAQSRQLECLVRPGGREPWPGTRAGPRSSERPQPAQPGGRTNSEQILND